MWDTTKGPNRCIMGVTGAKREEKKFEEIMAQHLPNFLKNVNLPTQASQWSPNRIEVEAPKHTYSSKRAERQRKGENLESSARKMAHQLERSPNKINADFSSETLEARKQYDNIFKMLKKETPPVNQISYIQQNYI